MSESTEWIRLYAAAMLESDLAQVPQRVEKADAAIRASLELAGTLTEEQRELESALNYLHRLNGA